MSRGNYSEDITYSNEYAICPNCGEEYGDCWEWVTPDETIVDCDACGNKFRVYAEYEVYYVSLPLKE